MYHGLLLNVSFPVVVPKEPQSLVQNLVQPVKKKRNNKKNKNKGINLS